MWPTPGAESGFCIFKDFTKKRRFYDRPQGRQSPRYLLSCSLQEKRADTDLGELCGSKSHPFISEALRWGYLVLDPQLSPPRARTRFSTQVSGHWCCTGCLGSGSAVRSDFKAEDAADDDQHANWGRDILENRRGALSKRPHQREERGCGGQAPAGLGGTCAQAGLGQGTVLEVSELRGAPESRPVSLARPCPPPPASCPRRHQPVGGVQASEPQGKAW